MVRENWKFLTHIIIFPTTIYTVEPMSPDPLLSVAADSQHPPSEPSSLDEHKVEEGQCLKTTPEKGEVFESEDNIILEKVPIITPNKDVVASELTFQVSGLL